MAAANCNANITNFCKYRIVDNQSDYRDHYSDIFGDEKKLYEITAYVKNNNEEEIEVTFKSELQRNPNIMPNPYWYDDENNKYDCNKIYLKAGTNWWFKYHILSLHEECVRTNIDNFDKNEMFMYAVIYGKLPEDIEDGSSTMVDKDIFSILPLLKPEEIKLEYNDNILLIACTRHNLKLVKFLVENCNLKLKSVIKTQILKSNWFKQKQINIYLLNELFELYYSIPALEKDNFDKVLIKFIENLNTYALNQEPPVKLVNQMVLDNVLKHEIEGDPDTIDKISFTAFKNNYITLLSEILLKYPNPVESPLQQSMTAKVCDALTPECLKTRIRVYADAGGSKKRAKKTRKQRKPRNSKRNHKK